MSSIARAIREFFTKPTPDKRTADEIIEEYIHEAGNYEELPRTSAEMDKYAKGEYEKEHDKDGEFLKTTSFVA
jgi:hypothetical protein